MRLSQASILCMRELFRTVVNDGDISEERRAGPISHFHKVRFQIVGVAAIQGRVSGKWSGLGTTAGFGQTLQPKQP